MLRIKKCIQCGGNSFKLLFEVQASVSCENCGQIYPQSSFKRLPDDTQAMQNIRLTVGTNNLKEITLVK